MVFISWEIMTGEKIFLCKEILGSYFLREYIFTVTQFFCRKKNYLLTIYFFLPEHGNIRGGSRIKFRVLQSFTRKTEHRNDVICRRMIDSARSKKVEV